MEIDDAEIQLAIDNSLQDLAIEQQARLLCIEFANNSNKVNFVIHFNWNLINDFVIVKFKSFYGMYLMTEHVFFIVFHINY